MTPPRRQYVQARTRLYLQMSECWNAAARSLQRGPAHLMRLLGSVAVFLGCTLQLVAHQIDRPESTTLNERQEQDYEFARLS